MIEVLVQFALCIDSFDAVRKTTFGDSFAVNHGYNAVHSHFGRDARPVERTYQGLGQGKARGFDHDVVGFVVPFQQFFHGRNKIIGNGAANATVRQLHDVVFGAGFFAAAFEDVTVNAQIAEFIDDESNTFALGILQDVADQRGLTSTEKAGDDGCGNLGRHGGLRYGSRIFGPNGRERKGDGGSHHHL